MFEFSCSDGACLNVHEWLPEQNEPQGVVVIVHGMGEYGLRYRPFAEFLANHGLAVYAPDLRGHGQTAALNNAANGHLADTDGWQQTVQDLHQLISRLQLARPGLPFILFGHSMGSLLVRSFTQVHGSQVDGAIHSAASGPMGGLAGFGYLLAKNEATRIGVRGYSTRMSKLLTGNFNRRIRPVRTAFDWLTRDEAEVDRYIADDRIVKSFTAAFYRDMIGGAIALNRTANMRMTPADKPMLFISGSMDPLGNYGKGVTRTCERYKKLGLTDVELILYPDARHELFQEMNRHEVMNDIWNWISRKLIMAERA